MIISDEVIRQKKAQDRTRLGDRNVLRLDLSGNAWTQHMWRLESRICQALTTYLKVEPPTGYLSRGWRMCADSTAAETVSVAVSDTIRAFTSAF